MTKSRKGSAGGILRSGREQNTKGRYGMLVSDQRKLMGRQLLPKTSRWQTKEIQCLCQNKRRMRSPPCRDDSKSQSRDCRSKGKAKSTAIGIKYTAVRSKNLTAVVLLKKILFYGIISSKNKNLQVRVWKQTQPFQK